MNKTVIYSHLDCLQHDPGYGHPESTKRLQLILDNIDEFEEAPLGTEQQVLLAHTPELLARIKAIAPREGLAHIDADTLMSPTSIQAAFRGTGASCKAIDKLIVDNTQHVFCATRPPGHHSTANRAMGFCLFNHIAIAALYAQNKYDVERIAIMDFDVHHGNGTQDIVKGKEGLFYISTHQSPLYPGTGSVTENLPSNILNVPLDSGTDHNAYLKIFNDKVLPALKDFKPQLLLISAGFDAHHEDPLASLDLTNLTYQWLGEQLAAVAKEYCESRVLSVLEGGYNIEALNTSTHAYLNGLEAYL